MFLNSAAATAVGRPQAKVVTAAVGRACSSIQESESAPSSALSAVTAGDALALDTRIPRIALAFVLLPFRPRARALLST